MLLSLPKQLPTYLTRTLKPFSYYVTHFSSTPEDKLQLSSHHKIRIQCQTEEELEDVGMCLADVSDIGDILLLTGHLGAGKTTLSRGFIRAKLNDPYLRVTSPTYLLDNAYQFDSGKIIHHFDLYRLPRGCDTSVLDIPNVFASSICLIEWPQRLAATALPSEYLEVSIMIAEDSIHSRIVHLTPVGEKWTSKLSLLMQSLES